MSGSIEISSGSESDLQTAVANVGPISVAVDGSNNAFRVSLCVCVCCTISLCLSLLTYITVLLQWSVQFL